jgi:hypothetical protein
MRLFRYVPGSIVVYLVVAACSAAGPAGINSSLDGGSSDGSSSGGDAPSLLDALTDPVPPASADTYQGGSRLKVQYLAGADGSKAFWSFYDTQRKEQCSFAAGGDGVMRCLPTATSYFVGYYADAGCTQALVYANVGCATPTYAWKTDSAACPLTAGHHVLTVGSPFTGPSIYILAGSTCSGPSPTSSSFLYFYAGSEVDPGSFVSATLQTAP